MLLELEFISGFGDILLGQLINIPLFSVSLVLVAKCETYGNRYF